MNYTISPLTTKIFQSAHYHGQFQNTSKTTKNTIFYEDHAFEASWTESFDVRQSVDHLWRHSPLINLKGFCMCFGDLKKKALQVKVFRPARFECLIFVNYYVFRNFALYIPAAHGNGYFGFFGPTALFEFVSFFCGDGDVLLILCWIQHEIWLHLIFMATRLRR